MARVSFCARLRACQFCNTAAAQHATITRLSVSNFLSLSLSLKVLRRRKTDCGSKKSRINRVRVVERVELRSWLANKRRLASQKPLLPSHVLRSRASKQASARLEIEANLRPILSRANSSNFGGATDEAANSRSRQHRIGRRKGEREERASERAQNASQPASKPFYSWALAYARSL